MAKILITAGPTRQYLDPVRYLSNASSGQMGACLAIAAIERGHQVVVVSGPVQITYPAAAKIIDVVSTQDMLDAASAVFAECDGVIAAAAPCDFQPTVISDQKIRKSGSVWNLQLTETPDVIGSLAQQKRPEQWLVGFALETDDGVTRAKEKLIRKSLDLIILNGVSAINSNFNQIQMIDSATDHPASYEGKKIDVARRIVTEIENRLIR